MEERLIVTIQRYAGDGKSMDAPPDRYHVTHGGSEVSARGFRTVWNASKRTVAQFLVAEKRSPFDKELMIGEIIRMMKDDGYEFTPYERDIAEVTVDGIYLPESEVF